MYLGTLLNTRLALPLLTYEGLQSSSLWGSLPKKYQTPSRGEATSWSTRTFLRTFGSPRRPDAGSRRSSQRYQ